MNKTGVIYGINGPVIYLKGNTGFEMSEMVYVGKERLVGEVIALTQDTTTVQVFEETTGLKPGEIVEASGDAISVLLAPGILNNIFDGIERPLSEIAAKSGKYISRGLSVDSLDTERLWDVHITIKAGDKVSGGTVIAETQETPAILHKSMVPPNLSGTILKAAPDGKYKIFDEIAVLQLSDGKEVPLTLAQKWPIRVPRPSAARYASSEPLVTGQRILDTMFPIAKGGTAAIPGGFGTGKTMTQHQIAKWANADIIIYIGCGERGNEMTQVLEEFSELIDPKSGNPLMDRQHLGRMILVSQTIPYRHACVLCQALDDLLAVTAVLDTVIHSSENSCGVGNALFLSDLRAFGIQISRSHAEIMSGYLEGAAGSRTGLLKNQSHVFAQETLVYDALFFLCFQFSGKVDEVLDLFRCKIF